MFKAILELLSDLLGWWKDYSVKSTADKLSKSAARRRERELRQKDRLQRRRSIEDKK